MVRDASVLTVAVLLLLSHLYCDLLLGKFLPYRASETYLAGFEVKQIVIINGPCNRIIIDPSIF